MYKIPGIVSLIQKKKQVLTSEDVVIIGCQIWKNKQNPALLKCICPEKDEHYLFDPYNPDLPKHQKQRYEKSKEIQHATSDNDQEIDLESGIPNNPISTVSDNSNNTSFWTDLANAVFGIDQIQIEKKTDHNYKEIRVQYKRDQYIHQTYNHYGAQLNSIKIV